MKELLPGFNAHILKPPAEETGKTLLASGSDDFGPGEIVLVDAPNKRGLQAACTRAIEGTPAQMLEYFGYLLPVMEIRPVDVRSGEDHPGTPADELEGQTVRMAVDAFTGADPGEREPFSVRGQGEVEGVRVNTLRIDVARAEGDDVWTITVFVRGTSFTTTHPEWFQELFDRAGKLPVNGTPGLTVGRAAFDKLEAPEAPAEAPPVKKQAPVRRPAASAPPTSPRSTAPAKNAVDGSTLPEAAAAWLEGAFQKGGNRALPTGSKGDAPAIREAIKRGTTYSFSDGTVTVQMSGKFIVSRTSPAEAPTGGGEAEANAD